MHVSVVIITKNQRSYLERSLPCIAAQEKLTHRPEIIVVDSGSTDGACALAVQQGARLVCLKPEEFGFARAHNAGAAVAMGDIVVRLSGDVVPAHKEWLYRLIQPFRDNSVAYTWGRQTLPSSGHYSLWERLVQYLLYRQNDKALTRRVTGRARTVMGGNMAFRRALWQQHPFDERLPQAEDYAWAHHWLRHGNRAGVYVSEAAVFHGHEEPLIWGIYRSLVQSLLQGLILMGITGNRRRFRLIGLPLRR
jgi:glycosyltransferase involved in cell wall biosynthesis